MAFLYNCDGVLESIYHLLWSKEFDDNFNHFSFFLPHTILIKNNMPITWYFSSKTGEVLRKKPQNISNDLIAQKFSKYPSRSSIAAMYLYEVNEDLTLCKQFHLLDKIDKDKTISRRVMIDYVSYEGLPAFLNDQTKSPFGILQKFIDPYGHKNFIIEALWTPKMILFSKKVNVNNLYYDKLELIEKAATFDGNDIYSEVIQIKGPEISASLKESLTQIVKHIATVSFDYITIKRMVCYLKIDSEQRVWLLWCGSCRVERERIELPKSFKKKIFSKVPHHKPLALGTFIKNTQKHKRVYSLSLRNPAEIGRNMVCPNCERLYVNSEMVTSNYQSIIRKFNMFGENQNSLNFSKKNAEHNESFDKREIDRENPEILSKNIPNLIRKLHPEFSSQDFTFLQQDPVFLQNLIEICLDCYMDLTKNLKISGPDPEILYKMNRNELYPIPEKKVYKLENSKKEKVKFTIKKKENLESYRFLNGESKDALENEVNNALKDMLVKEVKRRPASSISWISSKTRSTTLTGSIMKSQNSKIPSLF